MSYRVNAWHEALVEHLQEREWNQEQIDHLSRRIGRSALMSSEGVLEVMQYQQQVDEQIEAEREHDRWAIARGMVAESFFEDIASEGADGGTYDLPDAEGESLEPGFIQQRFGEIK